jgi:hypothetical protein
MSQFNFNVTAIGANGCDRKAQPGEKLYARCGKFGCPDCMLYDFVQQLKQKGIIVGHAILTHMPNSPQEVVDDLVKNERKSGRF